MEDCRLVHDIAGSVARLTMVMLEHTIGSGMRDTIEHVAFPVTVRLTYVCVFICLSKLRIPACFAQVTLCSCYRHSFRAGLVYWFVSAPATVRYQNAVFNVGLLISVFLR